MNTGRERVETALLGEMVSAVRSPRIAVMHGAERRRRDDTAAVLDSGALGCSLVDRRELLAKRVVLQGELGAVLQGELKQRGEDGVRGPSGVMKRCSLDA